VRNILHSYPTPIPLNQIHPTDSFPQTIAAAPSAARARASSLPAALRRAKPVPGPSLLPHARACPCTAFRSASPSRALATADHLPLQRPPLANAAASLLAARTEIKGQHPPPRPAQPPRRPPALNQPRVPRLQCERASGRPPRCSLPRSCARLSRPPLCPRERASIKGRPSDTRSPPRRTVFLLGESPPRLPCSSSPRPPATAFLTTSPSS
jgi:hypothetical protein